MCALCGVLGGTEHWTDVVARPGVFTRNTDAASRRRERMNRVAAANRVLSCYRMNLADWQGSAFVLSTATGKTEDGGDTSTPLPARLGPGWIVAEPEFLIVPTLVRGTTL